MKIKTGIGIDAHRFVEGRPLICGGIEIPHTHGLEGHSDADVLIHAIVDALVGPALGTDIGGLFPDTDMAYKGIDSKILLKEACTRVMAAGWDISNVDATIIAQVPKFLPHMPAMRAKLAEVMNMPEEDVTIKATTMEKMGFTGRKEGIAAMAVATLVKG